MKKILSILILTITILNFNSIEAKNNHNWNSNKMYEAYSRVNMIWNDPSNGLNTPKNINIPVKEILNKYGKNLKSTNEAYDNIDYTARTIFGEVINVKPRIENAYAVAQVIKNRMKIDKTSLKHTIRKSQFNATGGHAWLNPSNDNYDPEGWSENISQEELWIHCLYLAKTLNSNYEIPIKTKKGHSIYINVDSSYNFHDINQSNPFYEKPNLKNKVSFKNYNDGQIVDKANYYNSKKITKKPIKIGNHVYYTR